MNATLFAMDYVYADMLNPDQLLEGDLIEMNEEDNYQIVEVKTTNAIADGWLVEAKDEYGETIEITLDENEKVKLFVLK